MNAAISVIVCTYDPNRAVFRRCLEAISALQHAEHRVECIIVDNNSPKAIDEYDFVQAFLRKCPWAFIVQEREQGLTRARMSGFRISRAPLVVFIDDDNEPDEDYLIEAIQFASKHPEVGVFGPGRVQVEFTDTAEEWLYEHKGYFQESDIPAELLGSSTDGVAESSPYGTGMVLRREVMERYADLVDTNIISTSDRKGGSLSSCGDLQIVWIALRNGLAAGKSPKLKLKHLINGSKSHRGYIKRFLYSGARSYLKARVEVFPEERAIYEPQMLSSPKAALVLAKIFAENVFKGDIDLRLAEQIGSIHGYRDLFDKERPHFTQWLANYLRLE